jgi:hypothetical protein
MPSNRLLDIRTAALVACAANTVGAVIAARTYAHQVLTNEAIRQQWWGVPSLIVASLFFALLPMFYFALYRDGSALQFPRHTKWLAWGAAAGLGLSLVAGIWGWIESLKPQSVFGGTQANSTSVDAANLSDVFANLTVILLMIVLAGQANQGPDNKMPVPRRLRLTTVIVVYAWGLLVALLILRVLATPYFYWQLQPYASYASKMGRTLPTFFAVLGSSVRSAVPEACLFIALIWFGGAPRWRRL